MPDDPIQNLLAHLQEDPDDWSLRARACDAMLVEGRLGEAVSLIDTAPSPPEVESHVLKAAEVYGMSQPGKAVPLLYSFLEANPGSALAHLAMSETAVKLGERSTAQSYYERAVELKPSYRDPEFEKRHGVAPAAAARAQGGSASGVEMDLPSAGDPPAQPGAGPAVPADEASETGSQPRREEPVPAAIPGWVFTAVFALAAFFLCWMLLALGLRAMFLPAASRL